MKLYRSVMMTHIILSIAWTATHARAQGQKVQFELPDAYGRMVSSQDYAGVPIFLEFGACW